MNQQLANYTVVIEKQKRTGSDKTCYVAYVTVLGIAVDADSLEEVEKEVQSLIQFHIEALSDEGKEIPIEVHPSLITRSEVLIPKGALLG